MAQIPESGFFYANKFTRITLEAYEEVMGKNGLNVILNLAGLSKWINNYPPDNLDRHVDFADFTALHVAIEEMYGPRGARGPALRAGRATFNLALKNFGALAGVADDAFKTLPLDTRIHIGLPASARIFSQLTDQLSVVDETDNAYIWTTHRCPICWTRTGSVKPVCYISTGLLQALLNWLSGGLEFRIQESKCCAVGDPVCEFVIQKEAIV